MAVTINEMHVEVQGAAPAAGPAPSAGSGGKKQASLHEAMEMLHERKRRLRAD
jgi:hypothetical protein